MNLPSQMGSKTLNATLTCETRSSVPHHFGALSIRRGGKVDGLDEHSSNHAGLPSAKDNRRQVLQKVIGHEGNSLAPSVIQHLSYLPIQWRQQMSLPQTPYLLTPLLRGLNISKRP